MSAASAANRWPVWYAPVGLIAALTLAGAGAAVVRVVLDASGVAGHSGDHVLTLGSTLIQDVVLAGVAILLARAVASASAADFGLRPIGSLRLWLWAVGGLVLFLAVAALWGLVAGGGEQDTLDRLGVGESPAYLWTAGVLVVLVAPLAEELFFRGFCFRAVRNRFGFLGAAVSVSTVFGALHYTGPDTLALIPPLIFLGVLFCWLYERTGSLWPSVLMHLLNNALAFGATADTRGALWAALALTLVGGAAVTLAARRGSVGLDSGGPGTAP